MTMSEYLWNLTHWQCCAGTLECYQSNCMELILFTSNIFLDIKSKILLDITPRYHSQRLLNILNIGRWQIPRDSSRFRRLWGKLLQLTICVWYWCFSPLASWAPCFWLSNSLCSLILNSIDLFSLFDWASFLASCASCFGWVIVCAA